MNELASVKRQKTDAGSGTCAATHNKKILGEVRPGLGVNGVAWSVRDVVAKASNLWDRWVVDGAVNLTAFLLDNLSYAFRAVQNGLVQSYALSMLIGVFLLIAAGRYLLGLY